MRVVRNLRGRTGKGLGEIQFCDACNPLTGWYDADVLGIDLGITMLMAEKSPQRFRVNTFMKNSEAQSAMQKKWDFIALKAHSRRPVNRDSQITLVARGRNPFRQGSDLRSWTSSSS